MLRRCVSAFVLMCALFSGHLLARKQGHEYFPVQSLEQQLLHRADSDELRSQRDEAAADLRERHHWQNTQTEKCTSASSVCRRSNAFTLRQGFPTAHPG